MRQPDAENKLSRTARTSDRARIHAALIRADARESRWCQQFPGVVKISLLILPCGCSTQFSGTRFEVAGLRLKGQPLYVYSFLELRNIGLGVTMVVEVKKQRLRR